MSSNTRTNTIRINQSHFIFYIVYIIYLTVASLNTTMYRVYIPGIILLGVRLLLITSIIYLYFFNNKFRVWEFLLSILLMLVAVLSWRSSGYGVILDVCLMIIGARKIKLESILKIYFWVNLIILGVAFIGVHLGVIEHIIYYRDGKARYSFGVVYCTDFAAHVFYLVLVDNYLNFRKSKILRYIIYILISGFLIKYCDARLNAVAIWIVVLINIYVIFWTKIKNISKEKYESLFIIKWLLILAFPIYATLSIVLVTLYNPSNFYLETINRMISNRLMLGYKGLGQYGITLFGQEILMRGYGATNAPVIDYFFIDCSYLYIALRYGLVILILICVYFSYVIYRRIKVGDFILPIMLAIVGVVSLIDHHILEVAYNPFILSIFATIDNSFQNKSSIHNEEVLDAK